MVRHHSLRNSHLGAHVRGLLPLHGHRLELRRTGGAGVRKGPEASGGWLHHFRVWHAAAARLPHPGPRLSRPCQGVQGAAAKGFPGKLSGTSNVHLAMRFGIPPVGTVAHEWFMGTAAIIGDYKNATEEALRHWVSCFGSNLAIALTDTFGTREFLHAFSQPIRPVEGGVSADAFQRPDGSMKTYAELFTGVRQDSGDPAEYVKMMREYYDSQGVKDKKVIVFSDSLNIERCLEYKQVSDEYGFQPTFGVGTYLTNDFVHLSTGTKSVPLNIVIKLSSAAGRPAIKIRSVLPPAYQARSGILVSVIADEKQRQHWKEHRR